MMISVRHPLTIPLTSIRVLKCSTLKVIQTTQSEVESPRLGWTKEDTGKL